jgi:SAM-dependent methyltransferase
MRVIERISYLSELCRGKSVLHVGCCGLVKKLDDPVERESHLHYALAQVTSRLVGVDTDREELDVLAQHGFKDLLFGDANQLNEYTDGERFDFVLFGNMFNYLANPGRVLANTKQHLNPHGEIVITISNALAIKNFLHVLLRGRDPSFRHHVFMTGPTTLAGLLKTEGYQLTDLASLWSGPDVFYRQRLRSRLANRFLAHMPRSALFADNLLVRGHLDERE